MNEHEKTVDDRNYLDAETFVELYDADALNELVTDEICPECGENVDIENDVDHSIMVKAECPNEDCDFGFVDTRRNVKKYTK